MIILCENISSRCLHEVTWSGAASRDLGFFPSHLFPHREIQYSNIVPLFTRIAATVVDGAWVRGGGGGGGGGGGVGLHNRLQHPSSTTQSTLASHLQTQTQTVQYHYYHILHIFVFLWIKSMLAVKFARVSERRERQRCKMRAKTIWHWAVSGEGEANGHWPMHWPLLWPDSGQWGQGASSGLQRVRATIAWYTCCTMFEQTLCLSALYIVVPYSADQRFVNFRSSQCQNSCFEMLQQINAISQTNKQYKGNSKKHMQTINDVNERNVLCRGCQMLQCSNGEYPRGNN